MNEVVKFERRDVIGIVTVNSPPVNALSAAVRGGILDGINSAIADPEVKAVVLTCAGRPFIAGADITEFGKPPQSPGLGELISEIENCPKPVIAANRGFCFGVGFELSLACDFRIATDTTFYALPEQKLGQIPGSGGSARLQQMVGIGRTKDIVMRSRRIPGKQAYEWGIAVECVADAQLEATTNALVDALRAFSPLAQRTAKKLLNDTEDAPLSIAIELEGHSYSRLRTSDDFREGVEAFHSKRKPVFRGS